MEEGSIAKVIHDFMTTSDGEICINRGDIVQVLKKVDKYWYYVSCAGHCGNVPANNIVAVDVPELRANEVLFVATANFPGQEEGDLSFQKGQLIAGTRQADENWWEGRIGQRIGIFPSNYAWKVDSSTLQMKSRPKVLNFMVRVKQSMKAQLDEEMDLRLGDIITVTEVIDKDWYSGVCGDRSGIFPSAYVTVIQESVEESPSCKAGTGFSPPSAVAASSLTLDPILDEPKYPNSSTIVSNNSLMTFSPEHETKSHPASYKASEDLAFLEDNYFKKDLSNTFSSYSDDSAILEDDYFKKNLPTMFSSQSDKRASQGVFDTQQNCDSMYTSQNSTDIGVAPYGITLYPFYAQFSNELSFHEGIIVSLTRHIDKDWIEGEIDGRKGIFPATYVNIVVDCGSNGAGNDFSVSFDSDAETLSSVIDNNFDNLVPNSFAKVLYNFDAQMNGDISVKEDEIVLIVRRANINWCEVTNRLGQTGLCPKNYLGCHSVESEFNNNVSDRRSLLTDSLILQHDVNNFSASSFEQSSVNKIAIRDAFTESRQKFDASDFHELKRTKPAEKSLDTLISKNLDNLDLGLHRVKKTNLNQHSQRNDSLVTVAEENAVKVVPPRPSAPPKLPLSNKITSATSICDRSESLDDGKSASSMLQTESVPVKLYSRPSPPSSPPPPPPDESDDDENEYSSRCLPDEPVTANRDHSIPEDEIADDGTAIKFIPTDDASLKPKHPRRSAPPVPKRISTLSSHRQEPKLTRQPFQRQGSDRIPHRPAPPIPVPGQTPVRRNLKIMRQGSAPAKLLRQDVEGVNRIIANKEEHLELLQHARKEFESKIEQQCHEETTEGNEEMLQHLRNSLNECDETIQIIESDIQNIKRSMDDSDDQADSSVQLRQKEGLQTSEDEAKEEKRKKDKEQRQNVISELAFTEKEYVRDLKITYETFNLYNPKHLEARKIDVNTLFGNILEVMQLAETLLDKILLAMKGKDDEDQLIGPCFLEMADEMKMVYGSYCMNHDNALGLLEKYDGVPEIQLVFQKGLETLRYQIACFDMSSILIKPVQRILKYPLILNELIKCTNDMHKDKPELMKAVRKMTEVASYINEYKRRKDIVTKYLENDNTLTSKMSRISLHSVAKKSSRFHARLSSTFRLGYVTKDAVFDELERMFHTVDKSVRNFLKNVETFSSTLQEVVNTQFNIAEAIADFYQERNSQCEVDEFRTTQRLLVTQFWVDFKTLVDRRVCKPLSSLLEMFQGPERLVEKRNDKLLDYDALAAKAEKNRESRVIQEELNAARSNYEALNNQLLEELPKLVSASCDLYVQCIASFVAARKLFAGRVTKQYLTLMELPLLVSSKGDIWDVFAVKHSLVSNQLGRFSFISKIFKTEPVGKKPAKNSPTPSSKLSGSDNKSKLEQSPSQKAYLQSHYKPDKLYCVNLSHAPVDVLDLRLDSGYVVGVVKRQDPMGDSERWFVDDGANKGFVPSRNLKPLYNSSENCNAPQGSSSVRNISPNTLPRRQSTPAQISNVQAQRTSAQATRARKVFSHRAATEASGAELPPSYEEAVSEHSPAVSPTSVHRYDEVPAAEEQQQNTYEEIPEKVFYYAQYDFQDNCPHTLNIKQGQVVSVLHQQDLEGNTEWWFVEDRYGKQGYVPGYFLEKYSS